MISSVKTKDIKMDYFKFGNGNRIMVIIPGVSIKSVMESESIIVNNYKMFENDFTIYVFDRIKNMNKNYSIFDMATDMIDVIDELKLNNIYLFGTSQGGMISAIIAYTRPDLVKKLNINSITAKVSLKEYSLFDNLIKLCKDNKLYEMVDLFCKNVYSINTYNNINNTFKVFSNNISEYELNRFVIECEALYNFNILEDIKGIKCETLIVAGKKDMIFNYNNSIIINDLISNSRLYLYEDYGHAFYDEVEDFLKLTYDFYMNE